MSHAQGDYFIADEDIRPRILQEICGGGSIHVPVYIEDPDWNGEEKLKRQDGKEIKCDHDFWPVRKICFQGVDTGRRMLVCSMPNEQECDFVLWIDSPWSPTLQRAIGQLHVNVRMQQNIYVLRCC